MSGLQAPPQRLLPSPASSAGKEQGLLEVSILSVYDLPFSEPPSAVILSACGTVATSDGPTSRHKDRNSFRFSNAPNSSRTATSANTARTKYEVQLAAPLAELYQSKLTVKVVYNDRPNQILTADYELKHLRIHESKWLILNLAAASSGTTSLTPNPAAEEEGEIAPTIRLKLCLSGPYRPEVASVLGLFQAWFGLVDHIESNAMQVWKTAAPKLPSKKFVLLPVVPVVTAILVASPVVAGVVMVALPIFLPVVLAILSVIAGLLVTSGLVYSSTRHGREHVGGVFLPFWDSFVHSRSGQMTLYDVGPRPTPVSVSKHFLPEEMWAKLVVSLLIDLVGSSSYLLPIVGEGLDVAWAPMQTVLIMAMYDPTSPNLKYVSFVEEVLPFTDIVPTATIGWACEFLPQILGNNLDGMMNHLSSPEVTVAPRLNSNIRQ